MGLALVLALLGYYFVARITSRAIEKRTGRPWARYLAISVFWLIPTWDILPGWLYFTHVCEQEGGQKIFKTVELPDEYFFKPRELDQSRHDQFGHAYVAKGNELKIEKARGLFGTSRKEETLSRQFHVARVTNSLRDDQSGEILAAATTIEFYGGWVQDTISNHTAPALCPDDNFEIHGDTLWTNTLKRQ
jgi:hypothetical protein